jgi:hypothetical protein
MASAGRHRSRAALRGATAATIAVRRIVPVGALCMMNADSSQSKRWMFGGLVA